MGEFLENGGGDAFPAKLGNQPMMKTTTNAHFSQQTRMHVESVDFLAERMEEPFFLNGVSPNEYIKAVLKYRVPVFQI